MPTSRSSGYSRRNKRGFTLIEIVVVMGIIAILSSMMLGYSQRNSRQVLLATTQAKLASIFSRAKFLSIQSFFYSGPQDDAICGHGIGVNVSERKVFIFQDIADGDQCSGDIDNYTFDSGRDRIMEGELNQLQLGENDIELSANSNYVIFIPPEPIAKFDGSANEFSVTIKDENLSLGVTVFENGQISME